MSIDRLELAQTSLNPDDIETALGLLRREGSTPAFFELTTIPPEMNLVEVLRSWLQDQGYDYTDLKVRHILYNRLNLAMTTGTDRDFFSTIYNPSRTYVAMQEIGLNPTTVANLVTYVIDLNLESDEAWFNSDNPLTRYWAHLVYAPHALREIPNSIFGLHVFTDTRLIEPSLLAVFSPIPMSQVQAQEIK